MDHLFNLYLALFFVIKGTIFADYNYVFFQGTSLIINFNYEIYNEPI